MSKRLTVSCLISSFSLITSQSSFLDVCYIHSAAHSVRNLYHVTLTSVYSQGDLSVGGYISWEGSLAH